MRVAVAGALAAKPRNGGEAWIRMSYVLGLRRLGVDVSFVEEVECVRAPARRWFERVTTDFAVDATLLDRDGKLLAGGPLIEADILFNISGNLRSRALLERFPKRAYVDLDPCFTQIWHARGLISLEGHHTHFTVGQNIGTSVCPVPTNGIRWHRTRPPVVLDCWPAPAAPRFDRFTTVATWRPGHGTVTLGGRRLGLRVHAFRRLADLPRLAALPFEAALAIDAAESADIERLQTGGWRLVEPGRVASTVERYRAYVRASGAEFAVAQDAYTATCTGWLSDRTTRYLASGRPALVQDTGQRVVPTGAGLLTFRTQAEAQRRARELVRDYDEHCAAARALATKYFDSDRVLSSLLEVVA